METYPNTYNGKPLMYAALASQKNHMAVYLTGIYGDAKNREEFEVAYRATGKRLNAGKSCVRFRKLDDLPLSLVGDVIASLEVDDFTRLFEEARSSSRGKGHESMELVSPRWPLDTPSARA